MTIERWKRMDRSSTACIRRPAGPSIAPERLIRGLLLQVLYSVAIERQLIEQLDYNLLFRWFVVWRWMMRYGT